MEKLKIILHDDKFASLSSSEVVFATEVEEFFYVNNDEPVDSGDPIGIDVPIYEFEHLQHEEEKDDTSTKDGRKWLWYRDQEYEALINDWITPKEVKLVLFKNICWKPMKGTIDPQFKKSSWKDTNEL